MDKSARCTGSSSSPPSIVTAETDACNEVIAATLDFLVTFALIIPICRLDEVLVQFALEFLRIPVQLSLSQTWRGSRRCPLRHYTGRYHFPRERRVLLRLRVLEHARHMLALCIRVAGYLLPRYRLTPRRLGCVDPGFIGPRGELDDFCVAGNHD